MWDVGRAPEKGTDLTAYRLTKHRQEADMRACRSSNPGSRFLQTMLEEVPLRRRGLDLRKEVARHERELPSLFAAAAELKALSWSWAVGTYRPHLHISYSV